FEPRRTGTSLSAALGFLNRGVRRRAVVFLVSDFRDRGYERTLAITARRHDVVAISIDDPRERDLPKVGLLVARDAETGAPLVIDTSRRAVRDAFRRQYDALHAERRRIFRRLGIDEI